jgi:hypothetical protein
VTALMNRIKEQCKPPFKIKKCRWDANERRLECRIDQPHGDNIKGQILSNWYDISYIKEFWIENRKYRVHKIGRFLADLLEQKEAYIHIPELEQEHKNEIEKQYRTAYNNAKRNRM